MAVIKRDQNGAITYIVRVRDPDGAWYPARSFPTKVLARHYEGELLTEKAKGNRAKSKALREYTCQEYFDRWAKECRGKVSDGWKISQDQMWRDHIVPILGKIPVIEVKAANVLTVLYKAKEKGLGEQMGIHIYRMIHKMFDDAIELYEFDISNPAKKKLRPDSPVTKRNYLKPEDAFRLLSHVRDHHLGVPIWIMTLMGLRIGEVQGLRRKHLDLTESVLSIETQWNRKEKRFKEVKNKRAILVPMPKLLKDYLLQKVGHLPEDEFVAQGFGGGMLSYDTFEDALKRLCESAKVQRLSPHELRHTCSGIWRSVGAGQDDIKILFNHKSPASTKTYIHETNDRLVNLAKTFSPALFEKIVH